MTYVKLKRLAKAIDLSAAGETDVEQTALFTPEHGINPIEVLGAIGSPRYMSDQWGESVGIRVDCQTEDGCFRIDTDDGLVSSEEKSVPISEDACETINLAFNKLKTF